VDIGPQDGLVEMWKPMIVGTDLLVVLESASVVPGNVCNQSEHMMASVFRF
jgi:hypothetical protein